MNSTTQSIDIPKNKYYQETNTYPETTAYKINGIIVNKQIFYIIRQLCSQHNDLQEKVNEKDKEIDRLNNVIEPKEVNYNYLKLLFEKKDKEEVIKSYVYKCEQLEKLYKSYEEKEIEVMKKDNIIDELEKDLEDIFYGRGQHFMDSSVVPIKYVLDKLKELKEGK